MKAALSLVIALVVLSVANIASARAVMTPAVPRTCRELESWEKATKCLEKFGTVKVVRELTGVKLVSVTSSIRIPGLYVYREVGKKWRIAGMFEIGGAFEVFDFSRLKILRHTGFRFDLGLVEDLSPPEGPRAIIQQKLSLFCSGESYFCTQVVTSCDYLVEGRAHESFRGKLAIKADTAVVTGDRSRSGNVCASPDELSLGFTDFSDDL